MISKFSVPIGIALFLSMASVASAGGNVTMSKADGTKVEVHCNEGGCSSIFSDAKGRVVKKEQSEGGNYGYGVLLEKLRSAGYK